MDTPHDATGTEDPEIQLHPSPYYDLCQIAAADLGIDANDPYKSWTGNIPPSTKWVLTGITTEYPQNQIILNRTTHFMPRTPVPEAPKEPRPKPVIIRLQGDENPIHKLSVIVQNRTTALFGYCKQCDTNDRIAPKDHQHIRVKMNVHLGDDETINDLRIVDTFLLNVKDYVPNRLSESDFNNYGTAAYWTQPGFYDLMFNKAETRFVKVFPFNILDQLKAKTNFIPISVHYEANDRTIIAQTKEATNFPDPTMPAPLHTKVAYDHPLHDAHAYGGQFVVTFKAKVDISPAAQLQVLSQDHDFAQRLKMIKKKQDPFAELAQVMLAYSIHRSQDEDRPYPFGPTKTLAESTTPHLANLINLSNDSNASRSMAPSHGTTTDQADHRQDDQQTLAHQNPTLADVPQTPTDQGKNHQAPKPTKTRPVARMSTGMARFPANNHPFRYYPQYRHHAYTPAYQRPGPQAHDYYQETDTDHGKQPMKTGHSYQANRPESSKHTKGMDNKSYTSKQPQPNSQSLARHETNRSSSDQHKARTTHSDDSYAASRTRDQTRHQEKKPRRY